MGANVSSPLLAATVSGASRPGRETLGTISGTALERVMARMLQIGDTDADDIIRALADFPFPDVAERIIKKYHNNAKAGIPVFTVQPSNHLIELVICANYAFVKLAKRGHNNPVSINYLDKIDMPHLSSIYGAMLADVDFVTM
jgi:nitronate monooxygenase